jgi:hypothetical protein
MAELQFCSSFVKRSLSSISYLEQMGGSSMVEQPSSERPVVPISFSSKLVSLEGDRNLYQVEGGGSGGGGGLSCRPNVKRGRWEDLNLDATFPRHSLTSDLPSQDLNVGECYSVSIPDYSNGDEYSSEPTMSVQCSSIVNQQLPATELPYFPKAANHILSGSTSSSLPVAPYKECANMGSGSTPTPVGMPEKQGGNNIGTAGCQTREHHSTENSNANGINGHDVNVAEVLAELERERRRNEELLERICYLEAKLEGKEKGCSKPPQQDEPHSMMQNSIKKLKRVRKGDKAGELEYVDIQKVPNKVSQVKQGSLHTGLEVSTQQNTIVNWMSREEVQIPDFDNHKLKDGPSVMDADGDSDDSDDDDFDDDDNDENEDEDEEKQTRDSGLKIVVKQEEGEGEGTGFQGLEGLCSVLKDGNFLDMKVEVKEDQNDGVFLPVVSSHREDVIGNNKRMKKKKKNKGGKENKSCKDLIGKKFSGYEIGPVRGPNNVLSYKKVPKKAFCPKEVRRIMESGVLDLKNAQSHTIRKIIVFASLGIRHGCEDMYDLDFNYFSILRKGEPYISPKDPGEHVLYEQPGVRRKIFYPNRQNPILCPVQILEEEKAMRPSDPSCPSCLFLCIKYGGRTRNLPQNEYVRQRMGRNKLKSFGPLMCQMALLVHIRTGSFFFKALGITLLFMAGFSDDLVQKETKYRNLDLLQKYYRSDEDAQGEELFHPYPMFYAGAMMNAPSLPGNEISALGKASGKRQPPVLLSKPNNMSQRAVYLPPISARSMSSAQFGQLGFPPVPVPSGATLPPLRHPPFPSAPLPTSEFATSNVATSSSIPSCTGPFPPPPPYAIFPPYILQRPPNGFLPVPMWHIVNSYPPSMYPSSSFGYQSFGPSSQYGSHTSQPYYNRPIFCPSSSNVKEGMGKKVDELDELDSDSECSSSEIDEKCNEANMSEIKVV